MTAEFLFVIAGVVLSLMFSYIPAFASWFEPKPADVKRLIMLGLLAATTLVIYGLACTGLGGDFGLTVACDKSGAITLIKAFFNAAIANQTAYALTPASKSRSK